MQTRMWVETLTPTVLFGPPAVAKLPARLTKTTLVLGVECQEIHRVPVVLGKNTKGAMVPFRLELPYGFIGEQMGIHHLKFEQGFTAKSC